MRKTRDPTFLAGGAMSPAVAIRFLVASGFASHEAGNLIALVSGLWPTVGAWSAAEISRLGFLRFRIERDRIEP